MLTAAREDCRSPAAPAPSARRPRSGPSGLAAAARSDLVAMASTMVPFGVAVGVTTASLHAGSAAGVLGGVALYAGTAQLTALFLLQGGGGALAALVAVAVVNSRLLLYGASLEPAFRRQPLWFRLFGVHLIVDGTFVAAAGRPRLQEHPAAFRAYWLRLGVPLLAAWTLAVAVGVVVAPLLPELRHLALLGMGLFVSMLVPRLTGRPALASALAAGAVGPVAELAAPGLGVVAGALAGIGTGVLTAGRSS